jgi:O-antigen ligase
MTTGAYQLGQLRQGPRGWLSGGAAVLAGIVVGVSAVGSVTIALAVAAVLVLGLVFAFRSSAMLMIMVLSVFVESVTVGGTGVVRLVAPIALFALLVAMIRGDASVRFGAPIVWAVAYAVWALASGLWTVSISATESQLASLGIALIFMFAFAGWLSSREDLERVMFCIAIASCAVGAFAIASYLVHGSVDLKGGRTAGGQGDPNYFAAYQVVAIPLMLVLAGELRRGWLRTGLYVAIAIAVGSVLTTLSRGGLIALAVIILLTLVMPSRTLFRSRAHKTTVLLAVVLVGALGFQAVSGAFAPRLNSILSQSGGSGRIVLWQGAVTAIKERPLDGLGYGAYRSVSDNLIFRTPGVSLQAFDLPPGGQLVHNAYLGTAAELGFPGLVLFLGLVLSTGRSLARTASRARAQQAWFVSRVAGALIVGLAGWAIASIFISSETSRPLWVVIGIALGMPKLLERASAGQTTAGSEAHEHVPAA